MNNLELRLNPFNGNVSSSPDYKKEAKVEEGALVKLNGIPLLKSQYEALTQIAAQYSKTPKALFKGEDRLAAENGLVTLVNILNIPITTPDNSLSIPDTLVNLQELYCFENKLTQLSIPDTLVNLQGLACYYNNLTSLSIPDTLVSLQRLSCINNNLTSLSIPDTLVNLQGLGCSDNKLTSLSIPDTLVNLQVLYCSNNNLTSFSIPRAIRERLIQFSYDKDKTQLILT